MVELELTDQQRMVRDMIHQFAKTVVRPISLEADRAHRIPDDFLLKLQMMRQAVPGGAFAAGMGSDLGGAEKGAERKERDPKKPR